MGFTDNSNITKYTNQMWKGMIPMWIKDSDLKDETLVIYVRQLAEYLYSKTNQIQLNKLPNAIENAPDFVIKGWGIDNILDFYPPQDLIWDEDSGDLYKKYLINRFFELVRKLGTVESIQILITRSGLVIGSIRLYAKNQTNGDLVSEDSIVDKREIWYSNPTYRKYDPTAKFAIVLSVVSDFEPPYFFTPFQLFFDYDRAVQKITPYHSEYLGTIITLPSSLLYSSQVQIPTLGLFQVDFGKLLDYSTTGYLPQNPVATKHIFQSPGIGVPIAGTTGTHLFDTIEESGNVILKKGEMSFSCRVGQIISCPQEQIGETDYPTAITNNVNDIVLEWDSGNKSITLDKTNGEILNVTNLVADNWYDGTYKARIYYGNKSEREISRTFTLATRHRFPTYEVSDIEIAGYTSSSIIVGWNVENIDSEFTIPNVPVVPGTVSIVVDGGSPITDDGSGNLTDGGTIDYNSGFVQMLTSVGTTIVVDYTYEQSTLALASNVTPGSLSVVVDSTLSLTDVDNGDGTGNLVDGSLVVCGSIIYATGVLSLLTPAVVDIVVNYSINI